MRSTVVYGSFLDATKKLDPEQFKEVWLSILEYGIDGVEPTDLSPAAEMAFLLVRPNIDANKKRRKTDSDCNCEQLLTIADNCEQLSNDEDEDVDEDKDVDVDEEKKTVRARKRFAPPSVDEVREYCQSRHNTVDPEAFVAFYESKGWKVGNQSMKDWKSAVISWEKRHKQEHPPNNSPPPLKKNGFNSFANQHSYDFDALEREFLSKPPIGGFYAANDTG